MNKTSEKSEDNQNGTSSNSCTPKEKIDNNLLNVLNELTKKYKDALLQQRNQQNNISEFKLYGTSDNSTAEPKPSNWKFQKLEKDFLLTYLETALQKYNKQTCKNVWLPSKHKDYFQKDPLSKGYKALLSAKSLMNSFPCQSKSTNKYSQTINEASKSFQSDKTKQFLLKLLDLLKKSIEMQSTKPLLELNIEEVRELFCIIYQLNNEVKDSKTSKDNSSNQKSLNQQIEMPQILVEKVENAQTEVHKLDEIDNLIQNGKEVTYTDQSLLNTDLLKTDHINHSSVVINEHEDVPEKLDEIKNSSQRISEPYNEIGEPFKPPIIEDVTEDFIEYKLDVQNDEEIQKMNETSLTIKENIEGKYNEDFLNETTKPINDENKIPHFQTENSEKGHSSKHDLSEDMQTSEKNTSDERHKKESIRKITNIMTDASDGIDQKIINMLTNKSELFEFLLLVKEILNSLRFSLPPVEGMTAVFVESLVSTQSEARLSRMTNEIDPGEEILNFYKEICEFIDEKERKEDQIQLLVNSVEKVLERERKIINTNVQSILESPELFSKVLFLIHYKFHNIDEGTLISFFNSLPTFFEGNDNLVVSLNDTDYFSDSLLSDFVNDTSLVANVLAIIHLWNKKKIHKTPNISTEDFNLYENDVNQLKQWLIDKNMIEPEIDLDSLQYYKKSEIFVTYKEFKNLLNEMENKKLFASFNYPQNIFKVISKIKLSSEIIEKLIVIFQNLELICQMEDYPINNEFELEREQLNILFQDEELIRQLLGIVDYWVTENGQSLSTTFVQNETTEEFLLTYQRNAIKNKLYIGMVSKLMYWLKNFIDEADPEDTPQEIINANFSSTNIYLLKDYLDPDERICNFFQNPNYLFFVLRELKDFLNANDVIFKTSSKDTSKEFSEITNLKIDKLKSEKTEPVTTSPQISLPIGKNKRFSNSEAENKEKYSDNVESTYLNVSSIAVKNNMEHSIDDQIEEKIWDSDPIVESNVQHHSKADKNKRPSNESQPGSLKKKASFSFEDSVKKASETDVTKSSVKNSPPPPIDKPQTPKKPSQSLKNTSKSSNSSSVVLQSIDEEHEKEQMKPDYNVIVEKQLSFNTEMNKLSTKLDDAIASINLQYSEIKNLEISINEDENKEILETSRKVENEVQFKEDVNVKIYDTVPVNENDETVLILRGTGNEIRFQDQLMEIKLDDELNDFADEVIRTASKDLMKDLDLSSNSKITLSQIDLKNLSMKAQFDQISPIIDDMQESVEILLENYDNINDKISITEVVQNLPEICLYNSDKEIYSKKINKPKNEEENIIIILGFMVYYLLTIISSNNL